MEPTAAPRVCNRARTSEPRAPLVCSTVLFRRSAPPIDARRVVTSSITESGTAIRTTAAASDGADCAPRRGLAARDNGMNLPTLFAQTTAQCAANSSCADNGNCRFLHCVRIPCWHLPTPIHEDYSAAFLRDYRNFLDCARFARGVGRVDTSLVERFRRCP